MTTTGARPLREARAALVADAGLPGRAFGQALSDLLDRALRAAFDEDGGRFRVALVALGSYGRRELCPGSDVDVLLLHDAPRRARGDVRALAERLWYPLWDAGFVTGHASRTVKESLTLADGDLDALTSFLDVRHVVGDSALTDDLVGRARQLAQRRRARVLRALADAAELRRFRPGPVAEVLEPDVKDGAGGLRDLEAIQWAGWTLGDPGGVGALAAHGYLADADVERLSAARQLLIEVRVALHRATGNRSDRLALQEQDAVAAAVGAADADALVRDLASVAREVAWITRDIWLRVRDQLTGPSGRVAHRDHLLAEGVVLRDGRVALTDDGSVTALRLLEAAAAAADADAPFDRVSLRRLRDMQAPTWDVWERAAFLRLLRAGERAVPVFEALDHEGVLVRLLPEWEHVRSRPQRNAYHLFTVDRHLLEAVSECARLLDAAEASEPGFDGIVARACRRPELLLLGALLHDIGKGMPGDHSVVGAETATTVVRRIGLDSEGREIVEWLVRHHLLMADIATRRDLSDAVVADNLAAVCAGDAERLRLLYLLTIGDSKATGPAAWGSSKAALVRDLFVKAATAIELGAATAVASARRTALAERLGELRAAAFLGRLPDEYVYAFDADDMIEHERLLQSERAVQCRRVEDHVIITVVATDRPRLLATLAGALTVCGLDVLEANLFGTRDGIALDVFRAADPFGRLSDGDTQVEDVLEQALAGTLDIERRVEERSRDYKRAETAGPVEVRIDVDESAVDTVVEVHTDDEIGLLYRLASALADLALDVRVAKVATLGQRVVDTFYVHDANGEKIQAPEAVAALRAALVARLSDTSS
jgi:[protein-PII] uridylyltransferase